LFILKLKSSQFDFLAKQLEDERRHISRQLSQVSFVCFFFYFNRYNNKNNFRFSPIKLSKNEPGLLHENGSN